MSASFLQSQLRIYTDMYKTIVQSGGSVQDRKFLQSQITQLTELLKDNLDWRQPAKRHTPEVSSVQEAATAAEALQNLVKAWYTTLTPDTPGAAKQLSDATKQFAKQARVNATPTPTAPVVAPDYLQEVLDIVTPTSPPVNTSSQVDAPPADAPVAAPVDEQKLVDLNNTIDILLNGSTAEAPVIDRPDDENSDGFVEADEDAMLFNLRENRRTASARIQEEWQARINKCEQEHIAEGMSPEAARKLTQYELYPESIPRTADERARDIARENELIAAGKSREDARLMVRREAYYRTTEQQSFNDIVRSAQKSDTATNELEQPEVQLQ